MMLVIYTVFSLLFLAGCATKNDAGITLYKKPDLSKVAPGTPLKKVAGLKKPIKKEALTKGDLKGAEAWLFEWDLPNDEVNNKMFTSVVVKDGVILGYAEESADKWSKNPKLHKAAKMDSAWEDMAGYMAQAARYQAAASALANYNATRPQFDPVQAASAIYANSYQPWNNSGTVNYGMVGGGPIAYGGGNQSDASMSAPAFNNSFNTQKVYPVLPNSFGMRDISKINPIGAAQGGKVYPTLPNSLGMRDITKTEPIGVVQDGKVYPSIPGSGGMRDITKMEPIGVVGQ